MRSEPTSQSRRSILQFAGALPAALALGGMSACTPQANYSADQPHIADEGGEALWQAMELAARKHTHKGQFLATLEAVANQDVTLVGFIRKNAVFQSHSAYTTRSRLPCMRCAKALACHRAAIRLRARTAAQGPCKSVWRI